MIRTLFLANLILIIFSLSGCASNPEINSGSVEIKSDDIRLKVAFNENDRSKIYRYYGEYKNRNSLKNIPPGLAKKQSLPPGLQKHIEKKGVLHGRYLPVQLERELSPLPHGYVRIKVGGDVVLMNEKTRVVFDVVLGVDD